MRKRKNELVFEATNLEKKYVGSLLEEPVWMDSIKIIKTKCVVLKMVKPISTRINF